MFNTIKRPFRAALFLGILVAAINCERPDETLGLDVQPSGEELNIFTTDTLTIIAHSQKVDSIKTSGLSRNVIGNYTDSETGIVRTKLNAQLRLSVVNVVHEDPEDLIIDSVFLDLKYIGGYTGELNAQSFEILELDDLLDSDSSYYSDRAATIMSTDNLIALGFESIIPAPDDTLIIGGDTLGTLLRIPLKNSFGQRIMNESFDGSTSFADNEGFLDFFNGIQIRSTTDNGAIFAIDPSDVLNRMTIYYHDPLDEDVSLTTNYTLSSGSARYNEFEHDYSGTDLEGVIDSEIETTENAFIQSLSGVRMKYEFPTLESINDSGSVVVNKAELVMSIKEGSEIEVEPIERFFGVYIPELGSEFLIPDHFDGDDHVDGEFDAETNQYKLNITRFVQQMLSGEIEYQPLYIVPGTAAISMNRSIINSMESNTDWIRLNLTYSK